jgi:hypothetical protein
MAVDGKEQYLTEIIAAPLCKIKAQIFSTVLWRVLPPEAVVYGCY